MPSVASITTRPLPSVIALAAELREFYPAAERRLAQLIAQLDANDGILS
jgi:hypothetical protein